jgi:hypothetical protein
MDYEIPEIQLNWPWFYKLDWEDLLYAPNFVLNKDYELKIENKDNYDYPVWGWYYFENEEIARNTLII